MGMGMVLGRASQRAVVTLVVGSLVVGSLVLGGLAAVAMLGPAVVGQAGAEIGPSGESGTPAPAPAQAFRQWLPAALAGDAAAQYELGRAFADGAVTREDLAEAARWYQQAADQGNARAQNDLAILYNKGLGVPQDYVQAYVLFDLAAVRFGTGRRHDQAAEMRDMMAAFLTPEQFAEAKRLSEKRQAAGE